MTRRYLEDETGAFFVDDVLAELFEPFADVAVDPARFVLVVDPFDEEEEPFAGEEPCREFFLGFDFAFVSFRSCASISASCSGSSHSVNRPARNAVRVSPARTPHKAVFNQPSLSFVGSR